MQKVYLKRIKKDISQKNFEKMPDYEGFMKGVRGDVYFVGWLGSENSDLSLTIKNINQELLKDKYFGAKYLEWKKSKYSK